MFLENCHKCRQLVEIAITEQGSLVTSKLSDITLKKSVCARFHLSVFLSTVALKWLERHYWWERTEYYLFIPMSLTLIMNFEHTIENFYLLHLNICNPATMSLLWYEKGGNCTKSQSFINYLISQILFPLIRSFIGYIGWLKSYSSTCLP